VWEPFNVTLQDPIKYINFNNIHKQLPKPHVTETTQKLPQVPTEETLTFDMSVVPGRHCYQHAIAAKFVLEMAKQSGLLELLRKGIRQGAKDGLEGGRGDGWWLGVGGITLFQYIWPLGGYPA
jgi:hypothetical protein